MKKILMLALVVLVAGAAFAATDPVFSGKFSLVWGYSVAGEKLFDDLGNKVELDLKATIDDFNTVKVKMESVGGFKEDVTYWEDTNGDGNVDANEMKTKTITVDPYLKLKDFTLRTDVTGALGLDLPVSVTTEMGKFKMKGPSVADVAPYTMKVVGNAETAANIGVGLELGILDMVTMGTVLYPVNAFEEEKGETGAWIKATGLADMIDVAAYFIASEWDYTLNAKGKAKDPKGHNAGMSVAAAPMDGLKLGLGFNYDLYKATAKVDDGDKKGVASMKFDAAYSGVENLTAGLSYMVADFTDFVGTSTIALAAEYKLLEALSVYGGAWMAFVDEGVDWEPETHLGYDAGITTSLGALNIMLGASDKMDYKAPKDDYDDVIYVKFCAKF